ncbi:EAL/GGDEF domain-containing protein [Caballeronia temeraria]|uniref:EAL/GGDEF domain-containing protein n=1 Tax=Caballeronia temeraria TaxID=1777137 RepID=A0A157ZZT8_9BURK|nr:EAL domain-containing protein [Caballeronia temeraria]SAK51013.1 EAL/GGDEF domain-containing protein [Caballeronia temeraria]
MNRTTHGSPVANPAPNSDHAIGHRILEGLKAGEFCIAYQGIYRVDTGELAQMEALIRWRHPDYGVLLPGAFSAAFKDADIMRELTWFVLDAVASDIEAWRARGGAHYSIAVNVPPSIAALLGFTERMESICRAHGVTPDCIELELLESEDLARIPTMPKVVRGLKNKGVSVAMDDFGTGYSCLAALGPIDFGTVKIAKELVAQAPRCPNACLVFSSVLTLLTRLKVVIVVEGVETAAQAQWLAQWPHVLAQGFFLARPAFGIDNVPGARIGRPVTQSRATRRDGARNIRLADAA